MTKGLKVSIPKKYDETMSFIIAGDWHSKYMDMTTYRYMCKVAKMYGITNLIINGDFLDVEYLYKKEPAYKKWIKRGDGLEEFFVPETEKEITWGNMILDELQTHFTKIYYLMGNHEFRFWDFQEICPVAYQHNFNLPLQLELDKRNIIWLPYNEWLDVGAVAITHGMYHGATAPKKHFEAAGGNVIFSHVHYEEIKAFVRRGQSVHAHSTPAMCNLNPAYMKNRDNNWSNGFGVLHVRGNGMFNFYTYSVWGSKLMLPDGTLLK